MSTRLNMLLVVLLLPLGGCASDTLIAPPATYPVGAYGGIAAPPGGVAPPVYSAAPGAAAPPGVATDPAVALPPGTVAPPGVLTASLVQNPVHVPAADTEAFWTVLTDVVDDYFRIAHEERVRPVGEVLTEGRIDTLPLTGATIFEPWRGDSVGFDQRWQSTLQSIRRRAVVRVIPEAGGFLVEIQVQKELENLERPEQATAAAGGLGLNETFERPRKRLGDNPGTLGWIPLGRDPDLEQRMLAELTSRTGVLRPAPY